MPTMTAANPDPSRAVTRRSGRLRTVLLTTALVAASAVLGVTTAPTASAAPFTCTDSDFPHNGRHCAAVTAIDPGSYLAFHLQRNYTSGVRTFEGHVVKHYNGNVLYLSCYATGAGDADGHGDTYWFLADDGIDDGGWVNDWYMTTGSYAQWSPYIKHC